MIKNNIKNVSPKIVPKKLMQSKIALNVFGVIDFAKQYFDEHPDMKIKITGQTHSEESK